MMGGAAYGVAVRGLVLAVAAALLACRCAAQLAPPAGAGCVPELVSLSPCMDYMSGNATAPDGPCCSALSDVLRSSPRCLCTVLGGTAASLGVVVDGGRAMQLPGACRVQAPPASQCDGKPTPDTPAAAAPSDSDGNVTPTGSGSKATPPSVAQYSDGSISRPRMSLVFTGVSAAALLRRF